ncbi:uncharacterized protein [Nicotiana tomentosiformis]|uniref:uncharacterized protein n=1 Tax=Nicotiana tomentosiformis TaxID=4098 RepID=UPI00388CCD93
MLYHPDKANIVADALSRKSMGSLSHVEADKVKMTKYLCQLASLQVRLVDAEGGRILRESIPQQQQPLFELTRDGVLRYQGRLCVPSVGELRAKILSEAHYSRYAVHPGATKMYRDLRQIYWWYGMKKDIAELSERTIQTVEDMLRACVLDFKGSWDNHPPLIEFAYNNSFQASIQMAPYEALYGRKCRSPIGWFEVGETELLGPNLVLQAMEKVKLIRDRLRTAQSRQKSYADVRR